MWTGNLAARGRMSEAVSRSLGPVGPLGCRASLRPLHADVQRAGAPDGHRPSVSSGQDSLSARSLPPSAWAATTSPAAASTMSLNTYCATRVGPPSNMSS